MVSYCNAMRSTAVTAERQRPRLQQAGTCTNTTTMSTETKEGRKEAAYLLKAAGTQRAPGSAPHLHCQAFNEGWEGVGPGSSPPTHSAVLHCTHLSSLGWPGLPPRAPSLLQAGTQHCHYRWWHMGRMGMPWGGGVWVGWGCHGMVAHGRMETSSLAHGQDGYAMGWWHMEGWRCHGMVAHEQDGDAMGWWRVGRMGMPWGGGTWKGGDAMGWWRVGGWRHPVWHMDKMEVPWDGGT